MRSTLTDETSWWESRDELLGGEMTGFGNVTVTVLNTFFYIKSQTGAYI